MNDNQLLLEHINALKEHLEHDEGRRTGAYQDTKGFWTIGVGHLLSAEQSERELEAMGLEDELDDWEGFTLTDKQVDDLLVIDIDDTLTMLKLSFSVEELAELDPIRFIALFSMAFQLDRLSSFRRWSMLSSRAVGIAPQTKCCGQTA